MIINATWDHIYTRYGQDPWAQPPKPGSRHLDMFTNNQHILRGLFGYQKRHDQTDMICQAMSRALLEGHSTYINIMTAMAQDSTHLNRALGRIGKQQISAAMEWVAPSLKCASKEPLAGNHQSWPCGDLAYLDPTGQRETAPIDPVWLTDPNAIRIARMARAEAATDKAYADLIALHCKMSAACAAEAPPSTHREKVPDWSRVIYPCFVARKVPKAEASWNPKVVEAIEAEKQKHLNAPWPKCSKRNPDGKGKGTWQVASVRERDELLAAMKKKGVTIHLARVHALCDEKGCLLYTSDGADE